MTGAKFSPLTGLVVCAALLCGCDRAAQPSVPAASAVAVAPAPAFDPVTMDAPPVADHPASMDGIPFTSAGATLNGVIYEASGTDRKSTRLNSSHLARSRMPSSA